MKAARVILLGLVAAIAGMTYVANEQYELKLQYEHMYQKAVGQLITAQCGVMGNANAEFKRSEGDITGQVVITCE